MAMGDVSEAGEIIGGATVNLASMGNGYTRFQADDVLVAKITPCFENGKGALAHGLKYNVGIGSTEFHVLRAKETVLPQFLHLLTTTHRFRAAGELNMSGSAGQKRVPAEFLRSYPIQLPPLREQHSIIEILSAWDAIVRKTDQMIIAKTRGLRYLRDHHLERPTRYKRTKLEAVTRESNERNGARFGRDAIMAVTKQFGMRPMREETIAASIDRYKVVRARAFAYNPMRINIGSIAMSVFGADVLVSPDYVVFECDETRLLPNYLNHLRFFSQWVNYFSNAGNGSVRVRIYYDDLGVFAFNLPPLDVQQRIVNVLDAAVAELVVLGRYVEALKKQKRGLMQKLLTGQWRLKDLKAEAA